MTDILRFEIDGLNGRDRRIAYDLDRHVNVFFGPNGSGKTSILRIIDSALNNDVDSISTVAFFDARVSIHSVARNKNYQIVLVTPKGDDSKVRDETVDEAESASLIPLLQSSGGKNSTSWETTPSDPSLRVRRWAHIYLPTSRLYMGQTSSPHELLYYTGTQNRSPFAAEASFDKAFANSLQELWSTKYGEILGRVRSIQQGALQSIFLDVLMPESEGVRRSSGAHVEPRPLDADRAFERMSSFLRRQSDRRVRQALGSKQQFAVRYNEDKKLRQIVNHIDTVEAQIESEMKPIQQLSDLVRRLFLSGKSLSFEGPRIKVETESHVDIGLERLSSGEKHLIRILVAAMYAGESTLLIDEPELSMHIDWQRELVKNIHSLNPDCQLIMATHSPEIMADIPDEKIFRI